MAATETLWNTCPGGEVKDPLTLEGPCIIFCNIYTSQRDTQRSSTDCLLMLRCQLCTFRTVTVHPQELLFRCCMCRLWYVVRNALSDTSRWYLVGMYIYIGLHVKYQLFLNFFFSIDFRKLNTKFDEIPSKGGRIIPCGRTDMRTDVTN